MALIDEARVWLRVSGEYTDTEIQDMLDEAIADMDRCGVRDELLEDITPLVKGAMREYVKAHYGYDNDEANRFKASYDLMLANLLNSDANEKAQGQ